MNYYLIKRQPEGCDYTSCCGVSAEKLKAAERDVAIAEAIADIGDEWHTHPNAHYNFHGATLLEVVGELDLASRLDDSVALSLSFEREQKAKAQQEKDRADFGRLKAKFEP